MSSQTLYRPPAPQPMTPLRSLMRVIRQGDGDLLSLVPEAAYTQPVTWLGYSRRSILLVNDTELCRDVLFDRNQNYPKNDLMVGALEGLVGNSLFVSSGEQWQRQRQMIDPAFSQLRIHTAFKGMCEAVDDYIDVLDGYAESGRLFSIDRSMSHLTADIICRTIFSVPLTSDVAREVFADFLLFERSVASVNLKQLIIGKPWADIQQPEPVRAACKRIRGHINDLLEPRLTPGSPQHDDIVEAVISARDNDTGAGFTREELIDQIGVFFLAGHETTASVLTWVFFILSQQPAVAERIAVEVDSLTRDQSLEFEHIRRLPYIKNVFREVLRLYPPITFLPRVALRPAHIGDKKVKRGAMIMISPWTAHRNAKLWQQADRFYPERFDTLVNQGDRADTGVHMSFGLGPRVCVGASFATTEALLIIARLAQRYHFHTQDAESVRPVARLTTRPAQEIHMTIERRR